MPLPDLKDRYWNYAQWCEGIGITPAAPEVWYRVNAQISDMLGLKMPKRGEADAGASQP